MPTFLAECQKCGLEKEYFEKIANHKKTPRCECGAKMRQILNAPMIAPSFQPYQAVGMPGKPHVFTKQQHKDLLRRHGKVEVGNDSSMQPPKMSDKEFQYEKSQQLKELRREHDAIASIQKSINLQNP